MSRNCRQSGCPGDINTQLTTLDYTLNNPDTLTKYKTAAAISEKVLESVAGVFQ